MIPKRLRLSKKRVLFGFVLVVIAHLVYFSVFSRQILEESPESVQYLDRHGAPLRTRLSADETYMQKVPISGISPHFLRACVLIEDRHFYKHIGISFTSVFRALFQNIRERKIKSGASTITMQLAKLLKRNRSRTIWNKISEAYYALKLELHLTKSEILEAYINRLPFGNMIYGIQAASRYYFNKNPRDLSLNQAIYLALIPKSPTLYNPIKHLSTLKIRKKWILNAFRKKSLISEDEYQRVLSEGIRFSWRHNPMIAPHFIEKIESETAGAALPGKRGKITTTIDRQIQIEARGILSEALDRLQPYQVKSGAIVIIDNRDQSVIAFIGSPDYFNSKSSGFINYADALRQPGSTLKPFIYALALERGWTLSDIVPDIRFPARGGFFPSNHDGQEHGPLRLRPALANSFNIPAFYLAMKLTPAMIIDRLQKLGFDYLNQASGFYGETIALGAGEVKLFDLTVAYSVFAHGGKLIRPTLLKDIRGHSTRIFSESSAYLIWHSLADPNARSISFGYLSSMNLPFPLAIKTGTSKGFRDKWAIGVNSQFSIGVWLGNPTGKNMADLSGIASASAVLRDLFLMVQKDWTKGELRRPDNIVEIQVCSLSGKNPNENCSTLREELFLQGTEPGDHCTYHRIIDGRLTTVYPELYRKWARKNRLQNRVEIETGKKKGIIFPQRGDFFHISDDIPLSGQQIQFRTIGFQKDIMIGYILNDEMLIRLPFPSFPSWQLERGDFKLKIAVNGRIVDEVSFIVR